MLESVTKARAYFLEVVYKYSGLYLTKKINLFHDLPGVGLLVFQLFVYPLVERIFGPFMVSRAGAVCP